MPEFGFVAARYFFLGVEFYPPPFQFSHRLLDAPIASAAYSLFEWERRALHDSPS